jgi:serine/threonine protein kinase
MALDRASSCPSENAVLRFLEGGASVADRESVAQHLDRCPDCAIVLGPGPASSDPALRSLTPRALAPGEVVAERYRVDGLIGAGGMGEVYEVFDLTLNEPAALKTVRQIFVDNPGATARLKSEVQLARRVTHPNVSRIFDFGLHASDEAASGPTPFLTMELLRGTTLARRIRAGGAMRPEVVLAIVDQLASGLEAAHDAAVIHKDFKSDNVILIEPAEGPVRAVITDFGLAATCGSTTGGPAFSGTPGYIAPERLRQQAATEAGDVYALGIVLRDLLTGVVPSHLGAPIRPELGADSQMRALDRIARRCCQSEASLRPTVPAVREMLADVRRRPGRPPAPRSRRFLIAASLIAAGVALALSGGAPPPRAVSGVSPAPAAAAPTPVFAPPAVTVPSPPAVALPRSPAPRKRRPSSMPDGAGPLGTILADSREPAELPPAPREEPAAPVASAPTAEGDQPLRTLSATRDERGDEPIRALTPAGSATP